MENHFHSLLVYKHIWICVCCGSPSWSMLRLDANFLTDVTLFFSMSNILSHLWKLLAIFISLMCKLTNFGSQSPFVNFVSVHLHMTNLVTWTCWYFVVDEHVHIQEWVCEDNFMSRVMSHEIGVCFCCWNMCWRCVSQYRNDWLHNWTRICMWLLIIHFLWTL